MHELDDIGNWAQHSSSEQRALSKIDNSFTPASRPPPLYCFISLAF
jgi:hypothetical protein